MSLCRSYPEPLLFLRDTCFHISDRYDLELSEHTYVLLLLGLKDGNCIESSMEAYALSMLSLAPRPDLYKPVELRPCIDMTQCK